VNSDVLLAEAERLLAAHSPDAFDTSIDGFPDCIEYVLWRTSRLGKLATRPSKPSTTLRRPAILTSGSTRGCGATSPPSARCMMLADFPPRFSHACAR
jgi:hypothetical protein